MRTFHTTWLAFFLCFFGWFGIAPLMPVVRDDLGLTKTQIGNTIIASVAITILVRLVMGWLCDKIGPRRSYSGLLILGSIPVMTIGLAQNYESFFLFRLAIGAIGAAFVITQYHTSVMFAPNCVGTANAATAGWGNLGGGVTQMVMPMILAVFVSLGFSESLGWRLSMVIPGAALFVMGVLYYRLTKDYPEGNLSELKARGLAAPKIKTRGSFLAAVKDPRVWALFVIYGACFGMELTIDNVAALYFTDMFHLSIGQAGLVAGLFGFMNIFARALGGFVSDRCAVKGGLKGRVVFLGTVLFLEGVGLIIFSQMVVLPLAIIAMMTTGLFIKMSNGATYSIVPFVNKKALGAVAGIVGAGGNVGAVLFGFFFRAENVSYAAALCWLGFIVLGCSAFALLIKFSPETEKEVQTEFDAARAKLLRPQTV
jgi:NNP family nitrate/nitrite transporter-like MFS transporter